MDPKRDQTGTLGPSPATDALDTSAPGNATPAFPGDLGSGRFKLSALLGRGGYGVVYRAVDTRTGQDVALKLLHRSDPDARARFKTEFRTLADIAHTNLVALFELHADPSNLFFTMELIDGLRFDRWLAAGPARTDAALDVRPAPVPSAVAAETTDEFQELLAPDADAAWRVALATSDRRGPTWQTVEAVGQRLRGLVRGLAHLHARGVLHRDVKASNVLVEPNGRVVVLDFGLATSLTRETGLPKTRLAGTPLFMAPELCAGGQATEASDWYSVGVVLYHALTGCYPFDGATVTLMTAKQLLDPVCPSTLRADLEPDDDLVVLCRKLLARAPSRRPSGRQICSALGLDPTTADERARSELSPPLVGRGAEREAIAAALAGLEDEDATHLHIEGVSGIGKTTLVEHMLEPLTARDDVLFVRGRCFQRESMPYKTLEPIVDAVAGHALAPETTPALEALAALFPADARLPRPPQLNQGDPLVRRRRALAAVPHLLNSVANGRRIVLWIDDLQWSDIGGILALDALLSGRYPGGLLVLTSARPMPPDSRHAEWLVEAAPNRLVLEPLSADDAHTLVELAGLAGDATADVARSAGGNPFVVLELARATRGRTAAEPDDVQALIVARLQKLADDDRRVVVALALAGVPIVDTEVFAAVGRSYQGAMVNRLVAERWLVRVGAAGESLTCAHDQIRTAATRCLEPADNRALSSQLATQLADRADTAPETLAALYRAADDQPSAALWTLRAAKAAHQALAFERAAALYREALASPDYLDDDIANVKLALGDALENSGLGAAAAALFVEVRSALPDQAVTLTLRAAGALLRTGHIDDGLALARDVVKRTNLNFAESPRAAMMGFAARRTRLRLRGVSVQPTEVPLDPVSAARIDTCFVLGSGFAMVDVVRGADAHTQGLLLALRTGDRARTAIGLAYEAGYLANLGGNKVGDRPRKLLERARELAAPLQDARTDGTLALMTIATHWTLGDFDGCIRQAAAAIEMLEARCTGVSWEIGFGRIHWLDGLAWSGQYAALVGNLKPWLDDAKRRGDLYLETILTLAYSTLRAHVLDRPDDALRDLEIEQRWSVEGVHLSHMVATFNKVQSALYRRDAHAALSVAESELRVLRRALFFRPQAFRMMLQHLHGRACIAAAAAGHRPQRLLRRVHRQVKRLRRERSAWGDALAACLALGATMPGPERDRLALAAARASETAQLRGYAAAARMRSSDPAVAQRGIAYLADQGVVAPSRLADMLVPALGVS